MDSSGEHQSSVEHNIYKRRLDATGNPMSEPEKTIGKNYNFIFSPEKSAVDFEWNNRNKEPA